MLEDALVDFGAWSVTAFLLGLIANVRRHDVPKIKSCNQALGNEMVKRDGREVWFVEFVTKDN